MDKKKIFLITSVFPYSTGEEFIETEVIYWSKNKELQLTIIPLNIDNKGRRNIPSNINIDVSIGEKNKHNYSNRLKYFFMVCYCSIFYKEFFSQVVFKPKRILLFASSLSRYKKYYHLFDQYFARNGCKKTDIYYTFWHNEITYALESLKSRYGFTLVSRIHGGDLYEERKTHCYMPLKRFFSKNIDKIYTISKTARKYLEENYGIDDDLIKFSPLGVDDFKIESLPSENDKFYIVSCSSLISIKRIDKIIDSIALLSIEKPKIEIKWSHIGSGRLKEGLKNYAVSQLGKIANVTFDFLGSLKNKEVYEYYKNNSVDVFINVSESEGVPVSIIEAMSCHIPVVAPSVGGISDMLKSNVNGVLLGRKPTINEIANSLEDIKYFKNSEIRRNSFNCYLKKYSANKNYNNFISDMIACSKE